MSTITTRWTKNAILARLAASDSIDHDTSSTLRERAERRIEMLRVMSAVDEGRVDEAEAIARFHAIRTASLALAA